MEKELPEEFETKMKGLLGAEYDQYLKCFDEPRYYGLRVNTAKISLEEFLRISPWELTPIPWISNGFYYDGDQDQPAKHPYYYAGLYYLQEPSAMTPADRLPIQPGDKVLDLCAAPGGKATELGVRLNGSGVLVANDISQSRAKGLLKNLELFGTKNPIVICEEPGKLIDVFPEYFDKILLDAPCSGEGMFRKDRKMIRAWEEHGPDYYTKIQQNLILQAARMLKPGGMLMYSTCTFDPMEDEQVIERLLTEYPEFQICPVEGYEGFSSGFNDPKSTDPFDQTVRIFPHHMKGEGHYLALLKKGEERPSEAMERKPGGKRTGKKAVLPEELEDFLSRIRVSWEKERFEIRDDKVYYLPDHMPDLSGVNVLRSGLFMGTLKKDRFEPSQALAMTLCKEDFKDTLDFSIHDDRVIRYLKGETLDVSDLSTTQEKGWVLICVEGYPLGFGKRIGSTIKNKYLSGWRWQS